MADMIEIKHLNKYFGDLHVLKDINLTVKRGEKLVMIGPSGSGKSTLIRCVDYLEEPTSGEVIIDGTPLTAANRRTWQNRIGYVSQSLFIADGSFAANVALGIPAGEVDRERVMQALHAAQLGALVAGQTLPLGAADGAEQDAVRAFALFQLRRGERVAEPVDGLAAHIGAGVGEGVAMPGRDLIQDAHRLGHDLGAGAVAVDQSDVFVHGCLLSHIAFP